MFFETDSEGMVTSFHYHDLLFESLEVNGDILTLIIQNMDGSKKTKIVLDGVKYIEIKELIPKGIVLSCYSFKLSNCPNHLKGEIDFTRLSQYVEDREVEIFYADGTMGFEILVAYNHGFFSEGRDPGSDQAGSL